jgi:hypothetical protein
MGEHQIGGKGGWDMNQSSGQPPIKRLPNEMKCSLASFIVGARPLVVMPRLGFLDESEHLRRSTAVRCALLHRRLRH